MRVVKDYLREQESLDELNEYGDEYEIVGRRNNTKKELHKVRNKMGKKAEYAFENRWDGKE